jgi:hypothetical protein
LDYREGRAQCCDTLLETRGKASPNLLKSRKPGNQPIRISVFRYSLSGRVVACDGLEQAPLVPPVGRSGGRPGQLARSEGRPAGGPAARDPTGRAVDPGADPICSPTPGDTWLTPAR